MSASKKIIIVVDELMLPLTHATVVLVDGAPMFQINSPSHETASDIARALYDKMSEEEKKDVEFKGAEVATRETRPPVGGDALVEEPK